MIQCGPNYAMIACDVMRCERCDFKLFYFQIYVRLLLKQIISNSLLRNSFLRNKLLTPNFSQ